MKSADELFFFLNVDNTLLDNDCLLADLNVHLDSKNRDQYSTIFEVFRTQLTFYSTQFPCPLAETTVQRIGDFTVSIGRHHSVLSNSPYRRNYEVHTTTA
jgi:hypothetical protein